MKRKRKEFFVSQNLLRTIFTCSIDYQNINRNKFTGINALPIDWHVVKAKDIK